MQELDFLWAKTDPPKKLLDHLLESGIVAQRLLQRSVFQAVVEVLGGYMDLTQEDVVRTAAYLVACHDIGKCHPDFQIRDGEEPQLRETAEHFRKEKMDGWFRADYRHEKGSAEMLARIWTCKNRFDEKTIRDLKKVPAFHHQGKEGAGEKGSAERCARYSKWQELQDVLEERLYDAFRPVKFKMHRQSAHADAVGSLLLGLTILSDWLASGELFAGVSTDIESGGWSALEEKIDRFIDRAAFAGSRPLPMGSFCDLWPNIETPRPVQQAAEAFFRSAGEIPALTIIEAPMGEGKTEAGIYAALKMAEAWGKQGFYIGLPTMATSNQMYERMKRLLETHRREGVRLMHANAWLYEREDAAEKIQTEDELYARRWTMPMRLGMLSAYAVGTVDQAMTAVMAVKYGVLRLLGLSAKVLVIDEVHAYDAYMSDIIKKLLQWCRAMKIPVVMLSATLPLKKKCELLEVYTQEPCGGNAYPMMTSAMFDGKLCETEVAGTFMRMDVALKLSPMLDRTDQILETVQEALKTGGCGCVLVNTVKRAQELYQRAKETLDGLPVRLFHARFSAQRRDEIERDCVRLFGRDTACRPERALLIATQVAEQSLDLDFDVMLTQIAPVDLILQRIGRLHRHPETRRPDALRRPTVTVLYSEGDDRAASVYPPYLLERTKDCLMNRESIRLPEEIPPLVEQVYSDDRIPEDQLEKWAQYTFDEQYRATQAGMYELKGPSEREFTFKLNRELFSDDESASFLTAQTRLGEDSVKVALLPPELWRRVQADVIDRETAREVLLKAVGVRKKWMKPFHDRETADGRKCRECGGLLKGIWAFPAQDDCCRFQDGTGLRMDPELGFILEGGMPADH